MKKLKSWAGPMRPPFLLLTPACYVLGLATALFTTTGEVNGIYAVLALLGALAAHISVNAFNEFFDYKSGLDDKTVRTPFSGGSGTLPQHPHLARYTLFLAVASLLAVLLIGAWFFYLRGPMLLALGLVGIIIIVAYTPFITNRPWLCLMAPGLAFGPLMVMGVDFVLSGQFSWLALTVSLIPFFLVNNLLLVNQFPDVAADRSVGRRHLPIAIGRRNSSLIFVVLLGLTYLVIMAGVWFKVLPPACLIGLFSLVLAVPVAYGVRRYAENMDQLLRFMGMNVVVTLITPVLVAVGLLIAV